MRCTNGLGYAQNHEAGGYIFDPNGKPISATCQKCATPILSEYREKLGEVWSWRECRCIQSMQGCPAHDPRP